MIAAASSNQPKMLFAKTTVAGKRRQCSDNMNVATSSVSNPVHGRAKSCETKNAPCCCPVNHFNPATAQLALHFSSAWSTNEERHDKENISQ